MKEIERAFVAVVPPDAVLDALGARVDAAREREADLKWVRREQLHLTLQFLGRVPDIDALVTALGDVVAAVPAFTIGLGGAGAFPMPHRASVVWAGVLEGGSEIGSLAESVQGASGAVGFAPEERPFHPHVALARVRPPRPVDALLAALGDDPISLAFEVSEIVLFESETRPEGAVHNERVRLPLR